MSIETERLEINKSDLKIAAPAELEWFFDLARRGASPQQMALQGWSAGKPFSFRALARFIAWLCDKRIVANKSAYEFAEALRPSFAWRRSIVSEPLLETIILRWGPGRRRPVVAICLALPLIFFGLLGALALIYLFAESYHFARAGKLIPYGQLGEVGNLWPVLGLGLFFSMAGRSVAGASKFVLTRLASGEAKSLRFVLDLSSARLESTEASLTQRKSGAEAFCSFATMASPFLPALLVVPLSADPRVAVAASLFGAAAALIELSPFVRGPFTDALRYLYNWRLDQSATSDQNGDPESWVATLHVGCNALWTITATAFFAWPAADLFFYARRWMHFSTLSHKASAVALAGFFILLAAAFLDDLLNAVTYGQDSDRLGVRRMWRMRSRSSTDRAFAEAGDFKSRAALESAPLLRQLSPIAREQLIQRSTLVSYARGDLICRQGEAKRDLFVLLSGRASIERCKSGGRRQRVMILQAGSIFGETGFFLAKPRTADVRALDACVALEIRRGEDAGELDPERSTELRDRIWFLQALASSSFLKDLPGEAHDALASLGHPRSFASGEVVVREGESGEDCYFIIQGRARTVKAGSTIGTMGPGDAFGEIALLRLQQTRSATVIADTVLQTMELKGARLWELLSSNLLLAIEIERLAHRRLTKDEARNSVVS